MYYVLDCFQIVYAKIATYERKHVSKYSDAFLFYGHKSIEYKNKRSRIYTMIIRIFYILCMYPWYRMLRHFGRKPLASFNLENFVVETGVWFLLPVLAILKLGSLALSPHLDAYDKRTGLIIGLAPLGIWLAYIAKNYNMHTHKALPSHINT